MRYLFAVLLVLFATSAFAATTPAPVFQADISYGKLTVYSDVTGSDIYVDAKFVGQDRAMISNIPVGKHYVRVVKDETTIQSGIVDVKEGEETIIVAKPAEEELQSRFKKQNHVLFFGSMTNVGYNFAIPVLGLSSLPYSAQYGLGTEVSYAVPNTDVSLNFGFFLNYPSVISIVSPEGIGYVWKEGQLSISSPYVCISKNVYKIGPYNIKVGGGINYALYTPGGGLVINIVSRMGYMAYIEASRRILDSQLFVAKIGYISYAGKASVNDITSAGYFLQTGIAYQL